LNGVADCAVYITQQGGEKFAGARLLWIEKKEESQKQLEKDPKGQNIIAWGTRPRTRSIIKL
jgi:hypothetical protein